ncbi:hypothetical protein OQA88_8548 [Cercophora sp. LCS_1]
MSRTLLATLTALLLLIPSATPASLPSAKTPLVKDSVKDLFKGHGYIHILNTDDISAASMKDAIGCLNEHGMFTRSDCAVFTRADAWPNTLSTSAGVCTFQNHDMPENLASWYGKGSYAFSCEGGEALRAELKDPYYTVQGFSQPFVCNGNFGCHFEVPGLPDDDGTALPVWEFFWGSHQMGVTPGHVKTMWLWEPVNAIQAVDGPKRRVAKTF